MTLRLVPVPAVGAPDLVETARVLVSEYAAMPHTIGRWDNAAADIAALPEPYVAPLGLLLLALDGDAPVGCGSLKRFDAERRTAEIKRLYVRESARGLGVGEALMRGLITAAEQMGMSRVILDTAPELAAARALYARLGFTPIPLYHPAQLPDALCFERLLPIVS